LLFTVVVIWFRQSPKSYRTERPKDAGTCGSRTFIILNDDMEVKNFKNTNPECPITALSAFTVKRKEDVG